VQQRSGLVTESGAPRTLIGPAIAVGDAAPDFACIVHDPDTYAQRLVRLADTPAAVRVFSVVPSLDTPVCSMQTARFDAELAERAGVSAYAVSVDTPYAQHRACRSLSGHVEVLSDYRPERSFGHAWGVLVAETGELARAVFVVDQSATVVHAEIVPEIDDHPDYATALAAIDRASSRAIR
jgi:thiol peroxidase